MNMIAHEKLTQNLRMAKIMKATGYKDTEIATEIGISIKDYLEIIGSDDYLKTVMDEAQKQVATEVERKFVEKMMDKLDEGDSKDAMFFLERTVPKYSRKDKVEIGGSVSIDDIIKQHDKGKDVK
ncbi:MAG: hypothetical protein PF513_03120 [Tenericutes bacterium]|jgi:hypothetical protein|nr:hypothetical protein [Mycoplasmatota bacterium]